MDELIAKIDETVKQLLMYNMKSYAEHAQSMANMMVATFPSIVAFYADPRMADHAEDAKYWPAQLERIVGALNSGDDFSTADILFNETRVNLAELRDILRSKGII